VRDKDEHLEPMWPVCELGSYALANVWQAGHFCLRIREVGVAPTDMKTEYPREVRRWFRAWTMAILAGAFASSVPLYAQGAKVSSPAELARIADALQPGEWVWAPTVAPTGPVLIYVDLSRQRATVYRNGVRIAVSTISSGKPRHETPTGVFTILQKDASHHSKKYNNAPMLSRSASPGMGWLSTPVGCPATPRATDAFTFPTPFRSSFSASPLSAPPLWWKAMPPITSPPQTPACWLP
jgi:hypothetical protein